MKRGAIGAEIKTPNAPRSEEMPKAARPKRQMGCILNLKESKKCQKIRIFDAFMTHKIALISKVMH